MSKFVAKESDSSWKKAQTKSRAGECQKITF